jgi:ribosome biogenesis GTPase A
VCIELLDARAPFATKNPDLEQLSAGKKRIVVLNKSDLASKEGNGKWADYYKSLGKDMAELDCKSGAGIREVRSLLIKAADEKHKRDASRGIRLKRPVRALVCGIPNVGKSTLINALAKRGATKTGNKPGVTKGKQWITVSKEIELLDSPGLLWPKIEDETASVYLALIGSMNDEAIDTDTLAVKLIDLLKERYPEILKEKYEAEVSDPVEEILIKAAEKGNMVKKGGTYDTERALKSMLDSFRSGKLGRITLELP